MLARRMHLQPYELELWLPLRVGKFPLLSIESQFHVSPARSFYANASGRKSKKVLPD
jgi:hypothetical protein